MCLDKCSKKKKCPDGLECKKICLLDSGFETIKEKQTSEYCENTKNMVPFEGGCLPACKKNSDCKKKTIEGVKSIGCKSVCYLKDRRVF